MTRRREDRVRRARNLCLWEEGHRRFARVPGLGRTSDRLWLDAAKMLRLWRHARWLVPVVAERRARKWAGL